MGATALIGLPGWHPPGWLASPWLTASIPGSPSREGRWPWRCQYCPTWRSGISYSNCVITETHQIIYYIEPHTGMLQANRWPDCVRCIELVNGGNSKSPVIAAILSFFIPGLGQVYNGQGFVKGLMYMVATLIGYMVLIIPGMIIWLYGIYNAYSVAKKINASLLPYKYVGVGSLIIFAVVGFAIIFVGVLAFTFVMTAIIATFAVLMEGASGY
jgi:TM2 domain-containing membrane protein YozV